MCPKRRVASHHYVLVHVGPDGVGYEAKRLSRKKQWQKKKKGRIPMGGRARRFPL